METTSGFKWFENLCRTCMRDESEMKATAGAEAAHQWKCIFDTIEDETSSIIEFLTKSIPQIEVQVNDTLPKKICDECLPQLLNSYRFQQTCLQSEKQLRQLLAKSEIEVEITIEPMHTEFVKSGNGKDDNGEVKSAATVADPLQIAGTDHDGELCKNMEHINGSEFVKVEQDDVDVSATTTQELSIFDTYQANVEAESKIESIATQLVNECTSNEEREDGQQQQENGGGSSSMHNCSLCPKTFEIRRCLVQHLRRCHKQYATRKNAARHALSLQGDVKTTKGLSISDICVANVEAESKIESIATQLVNECTSNEEREDGQQRQESGGGSSSMHTCNLCPSSFKIHRYLIQHLRRTHKICKQRKNADSYANVDAESKLESLTTQLVNECTSKEEREDGQQQQESEGGSSSMHNCTLCPRTFKFRRYLIQHLRRCHKQYPQPKNAATHAPPLQGDAKTTTTKVLNIADTSVANVDAESKLESLTTQLVNECTSKVEREDGQQQQESGGGSSSMYTCTLCPKTFKIRRYLGYHMKRFHKIYNQRKNTIAMTNDKPPRYMCEMCDKTYGSRGSLSEHKRLKHNAAAGSGERRAKLFYTCEYCNKTLKRTKGKDHIRIHTGERPYLCAECGKTFRTSGALKEHLVRHTGVKCFECPECPKKFPYHSDLAAHKMVHSRIKSHKCDVCGSGFAHPSHLRKHKRSYHSGGKRYKCEMCEMRFFRMSHQVRHMRTHTGEKPYKCKYCTRAFAQSNDLIKHLRTHLGDKVYMCELCPSTFRMASELREHFATHKNDDAETRERNLKALHEQVKLREMLVRPEPEVSGVLEEEVAELKGDETS